MRLDFLRTRHREAASAPLRLLVAAGFGPAARAAHDEVR